MKLIWHLLERQSLYFSFRLFAPEATGHLALTYQYPRETPLILRKCQTTTSQQSPAGRDLNVGRFPKQTDRCRNSGLPIPWGDHLDLAPCLVHLQRDLLWETWKESLPSQ